jgi:CDP-4-dehydro-6-deoxyglucose reductase, E1
MIPLMKSAFLHEAETREALAKFILEAPRLSMDAKCWEFEAAFADFQGSRDAVLFNSGGSANLAMLQALKNIGRLKNGDTIGFSAVTWSTNVMPILQLGMVPVPVDCSPDTLNAMCSDIERTHARVPLRAMFITNALGFAGDLGRTREFCTANDIVLVEDNCESLGTELDDGRTGTFGVCASFSFFVAHHMSTIEGGMVCTNDEALSDMLRVVRANGWDRNLSTSKQIQWRARHRVRSDFQAKYTFYDLGYNLRPTEITGFIGLQQLRYVAATFLQRQDNFLRLEGAALRNPDFLRLRRDHIRLVSSFAFPIVCRTADVREKYVNKFAEAGVETRPLIAGNMQRQPFFKKYSTYYYDLPGADVIHECGMYCGNTPEFNSDELAVIETCLAP